MDMTLKALRNREDKQRENSKEMEFNKIKEKENDFSLNIVVIIILIKNNNMETNLKKFFYLSNNKTWNNLFFFYYLLNEIAEFRKRFVEH